MRAGRAGPMVRAGVEGKTRSGGGGSPVFPPPRRRRRRLRARRRPLRLAGGRSTGEAGSRASARSREGGARRWPGRSAAGCRPPPCRAGAAAAGPSRWFRRPAGAGRGGCPAGGRGRRPTMATPTMVPAQAGPRRRRGAACARAGTARWSPTPAPTARRTPASAPSWSATTSSPPTATRTPTSPPPPPPTLPRRSPPGGARTG
ncbi:hypothetical protein PVAP13_3KG265479 [Panicum virgatum]|uniref:Uncharacterized protein n=1 Tax=Panicum virgatum TaxID=38727 RepID=A0A8T0UUB8_PANVG|nr:hypothetical protein PVAP13_3KG265479 [Panicum virgatum]